MSNERYGYAFQHDVNMICLWWYSVPLTSSGELALAATDNHATNALTLPGIYAFEGRHDSRPEGGLLYIGRVGKRPVGPSDGKDRARALRDRIEESGARFVWKEAGDSGLHADIWDVTIRFAAVDPEVVTTVEALLIRAHAPSFNAQQVRGPITDREVLSSVVMNGGAKGRLLPAVAGGYYDQELWRMKGG